MFYFEKDIFIEPLCIWNLHKGISDMTDITFIGFYWRRSDSYQQFSITSILICPLSNNGPLDFLVDVGRPANNENRTMSVKAHTRKPQRNTGKGKININPPK